MRKITLILLLIGFSIIFNGCGGRYSPVNLPDDPNYIFATGRASSPELQTALDIAAINARTQIVRELDTYIKNYQKKFDEQTGFGENAELIQQFTQATKAVSEKSLSLSKMIDQKWEEDDGIFYTTVVVRYPYGAANKDLLNQIKDKKALYTRFRATEAFKELEQDVEKYRQFKNSGN